MTTTITVEIGEPDLEGRRQFTVTNVATGEILQQRMTTASYLGGHASCRTFHEALGRLVARVCPTWDWP